MDDDANSDRFSTNSAATSPGERPESAPGPKNGNGLPNDRGNHAPLPIGLRQESTRVPVPLFQPRLFPWLLLTPLRGILASNWLRQSAVRQGHDPPLRAGPKTGQHVQLTIDYGDGEERHFPSVPWCADMTVFDALLWAAHHPHGIAFEYQGTGAHGAGIQTLVLAIDSVANQGGGDSARNWVYEVNGRKAQDSCGVHLLQPADTILWKFTTY